MTQLHVDVYTCPMRDLANGGQFSPTTSTLVAGPTEMVLVDAQYMESDVAEIARRIEASGRTLTTIYITHSHADHYFGMEWLLNRFPRARAVALPAVVSEIEAGNEAARAQWSEFFRGEALDNTAVPEPLDGDTITVDGEPLHVINVGQADIPNNTIVHIPSIGAVIAGDAIYNGINPFLAASAPDDWPRWIASVDKVAALKPRVVIAGHKRPELPDDDLVATIDATRGYIRDFIQELNDSSDSRELVTRMQRRYPDHGNPSALILSALTAMKHKRAAGS
jgi:glyoxylase-like metal-dependent hydrolase (beta-lactamase superfamily II)